MREDDFMIHAAIVPPAIFSRANGIVVSVARRWRTARDYGEPVQQHLHALLSPRDWGMLSPAFDSLLTLWEQAIARRLSTGYGQALSRDERTLLGFLDGTVQPRWAVACSAGAERALDVAIRSTRVMMMAHIDPAMPGAAA